MDRDSTAGSTEANSGSSEQSLVRQEELFYGTFVNSYLRVSVVRCAAPIDVNHAASIVGVKAERIM